MSFASQREPGSESSPGESASGDRKTSLPRKREALWLTLWTVALLGGVGLLFREFRCTSEDRGAGGSGRPRVVLSYGLQPRESGVDATLSFEIHPGKGRPGGSSGLPELRLRSLVPRAWAERRVRIRAGSTGWRVSSVVRSVSYRTTGGGLTEREHEDFVIEWIEGSDGTSSTLQGELQISTRLPPFAEARLSGFASGDRGFLPGEFLFLLPEESLGVDFQVKVDVAEGAWWLSPALETEAQGESLPRSVFAHGDFEVHELEGEAGGEGRLRVLLDKTLADERRTDLLTRTMELAEGAKGMIPAESGGGNRELNLFYFGDVPLLEGLSGSRTPMALACDFDFDADFGGWRWTRVARGLLRRRCVDEDRFRPEDAWLAEAGIGFLASSLVDFREMEPGERGSRPRELQRWWRSYSLSRVEHGSYRLSNFRLSAEPARSFCAEVSGPLTLEKMSDRFEEGVPGTPSTGGEGSSRFRELLGRFLGDPDAVVLGWTPWVRQETGVDLSRFQRDFVGGTKRLVSVGEAEPLSSLGGSPEEDVGKLVGFVAVTGGLQGDRRPCSGCPDPVERMRLRQEKLSRVLGKGKPRLLIDLGDALPRAGISGAMAEDFELARVHFQRMDEAGYDLLVPSVEDLLWGVDLVRGLLGEVGFLAVSCNVLGPSGEPEFRSHARFEMGGQSLAVIGVTAPHRNLLEARHRERGFRKVRVGDPVPRVLEVAREVRDEVDAVWVAGGLSPEEVRRLGGVPGLIDLVISTQDDWYEEGVSDSSGQIRGTAVVHGMARFRGLDWGELAVATGTSLTRPRLLLASWSRVGWED